MIEISSDKFGWEGKKGYEEASTVFGPGKIPTQFKIRSERTGKVQEFKLCGKDTREGETTAFNFRSGEGIEVKLFND